MLRRIVKPDQVMRFSPNVYDRSNFECDGFWELADFGTSSIETRRKSQTSSTSRESSPGPFWIVFERLHGLTNRSGRREDFVDEPVKIIGLRQANFSYRIARFVRTSAVLKVV